MQIFKIKKIKNNSIYLHDDDIHHILKVLHKKNGDVIFCTDNKKIYETKIISSIPMILEIISEKDNEIIPYNINCYIGVIDKKAFETTLINLNQLNCKSITPVLFSRSQGNIKYDNIRLLKIVDESNKQCGRINSIAINNTITFEQMLDKIDGDNWIVAYEKESSKNNIIHQKGVFNIIIGPEGGITLNEYKSLMSKNIKSISLTNTILKTEIASTYLASIIINKIKNGEEHEQD